MTENNEIASTPATTPETTQGEQAQETSQTPEVDSKLALKLAKQTRQVREAQAKIKQEAEARQKAEQKFKDLFSDLKTNPNKAKQILQEANVSFDEFARSFVGLEPEDKPIKSELEELKQQIKQKEENEKKQLEEQRIAQQKRNLQIEQERDLAHIVKVLDEDQTDKYELVKANNAQKYVQQNIYKFIRDNANDWAKLTAEEQNDLAPKLIEKFSIEMENNLIAKAQEISQKISKLNKLKKMGINLNIMDPNDLTGSNLSKLDPASAELVRQMSVSERKPSKFITNESTTDSRPVGTTPKVNTFGNHSDMSNEIDRVLRKHGLA